MTLAKHYADIYVIVDPRDRQVRYVGQSGNVETRKKGHIQAMKWNWKRPVYDWLRELKILELEPIFVVVEWDVSVKEVIRKERDWCRYYLALGCNLLNGEILWIEFEKRRLAKKKAA